MIVKMQNTIGSVTGIIVILIAFYAYITLTSNTTSTDSSPAITDILVTPDITQDKDHEILKPKAMPAQQSIDGNCYDHTGQGCITVSASDTWGWCFDPYVAAPPCP